MAGGTQHGARLLGLRVPHDLSIIGFDDVPLAQCVDPQLSTMRQDMAALGARHADAHGSGAVSGGGKPLDMAAELLERGSCAAPGDR